MEFSIEMLRNTLLIALILILVYVLYKRLLKTLDKNRINGSYSELLNQDSSELLDGDRLVIRFRHAEKGKVHLVVHSPEGVALEVLADEELEAGDHQFHFRISQRPSGKYSYHLHTHNQKSTRYFQI